MLAHARPGDAAFAACLRLFRHYPLAVRRHYAEHRYGSMVLMTRDAGVSAVLRPHHGMGRPVRAAALGPP